MKILFLTPWYPDDQITNHGVFVREQASAIASKHEVALISSKIDHEKFGLSSYEISESVFEGVKEYRVVIKRSVPIFNQLNYFFISRKVAVKIAQAFKPDIIHGNIGYPGAFWSWLVSRAIGKPFVITEHTFIYNNFRSFFHKLLTLFSIARATGLITVSTKAAVEIGKYSKAKVTVIPNIVDASRFFIEPYVEGKVNIGFLGRLSAVKGLDVLLRVLSKVKADFHLHIGGNGEMMTEYQLMAKELGLFEKCTFHGFITPGAMPAFMSRLHFFVNTSRFESFGIAIIEAMASGIPAICFDNGGPADFVNPLNGILVENQNEEKLGEAILQMISNYPSYKREKIRENVLMKFSKQKFITAMEEVYSSAVSQYLIKQLP